MAKTDAQQHQECMRRFIDLANEMKNDGTGTNIISAALMSASAVYANYVAAGNSGGLTESGVDKIVEAYRHQMNQVQRAKKAEFDRANAEASS